VPLLHAHQDSTALVRELLQRFLYVLRETIALVGQLFLTNATLERSAMKVLPPSLLLPSLLVIAPRVPTLT
jgi:hypothetical protein